MADCNKTLPNPSQGCDFDMNEVQRILFSAYKNETNAINTLSLTDAASLTALQARFDVPDLRDNSVDNDALTKLVPSSQVWGVTNEQGDPVENTDDGYYAKLAEGDYDIMIKFKNPSPYYIQQLKELEGIETSMYLLDANDENVARIWGKLNSTNLDPIRCRISVPNFNIASREAISEVIVKVRVINPKDMNYLYAVNVTGADVTSDVDFYSLINVNAVGSSPAVTGESFTATSIDFLGNEPLTGVTYDEITYRQSDDESITVTLASAGSLSEPTAGNYVVSEVALLTSGKSYIREIRKDGFNVIVETIAIP